MAHDESAEVAEPSEGALDGPSSLIAAQGSTILGGRLAPVLAMRGNQLDAARRQLFAQGIAIIAAVGDETNRLLPWPTGSMPSPYADRRERRGDELDLRRGGRVKVVSQRKTRAVDHHHPLRPLAPLGLADPGAPFFAGAKLPSRKDSLQFIGCRSLSSPRKVRQIFSQTSCSSPSRSLRHQVEGEGNSSGLSCQRAPLRKIHKIPSSTLRSGDGGRPPRGRGGRLGSNGRIFSPWASVNNRPYRAIGPPSGAYCSPPASPRENNYLTSTLLYRVLQWLLVITDSFPSFIPPAIRMVRALNIVRHAAVGITLSFLKV
jgi:hypothetical protein